MRDEMLLTKLNGSEISKKMVTVIPATETQINTANERNKLVNDDQLFMMRPEERTRRRIVIRMAHNLNGKSQTN